MTVGQALSFEVTLGATTGMYQFESMRSQKTINLSSVRIEVHDRSGESDFEAAKIPETMNANLNNPESLSIESLKEMFQQSYSLLFKVKESLFPASQS